MMRDNLIEAQLKYAPRLTKCRRVCSPPGAVQLRSHDMGIGFTDDGREVYFAWGENMDRQEAAKRSDVCDVAHIGTVWPAGEGKRDNYSTVIPDRIAQKILSISVID